MQHVISVTVENKPGVLARISSMFARRGFNIHSLTVGPTEDPNRSQMTVVVDGPEMEQIVKQLYKLIHTLKVTEHIHGEAIEREIMLVRVNADPKRRGEILDAANIFEANAVDVGVKTITFEVVGEPSRLADFLEIMRIYGIVSLVKSGRIVLDKDMKFQPKKQRRTE
jgi:acetolactate synthase-1/3 small subunit